MNALLWVGTTAALVISAGLIIFLLWQRRGHTQMSDGEYRAIEDEIRHISMAQKKFRLREIRTATRGFSPHNKIGEGGSGIVYKGFLRGNDVAVKRMSKNSHGSRQAFLAEVTSTGSLHHRNLVRLIGWCIESPELLLVYEFLPNGSLDKYLYEDERDGSILHWTTRHHVICGVAHAVDYLHNKCEKQVLHRDIKASNILLDSNFCAKLGDFGLARTIQRSETHHSTEALAGTFGCMAPESMLTRRITVEMDVYSLGVVVLQVVCGMRRGNRYAQEDGSNDHIVGWVWDLYGKGKLLDAVDRRIRKGIDEEKVAEVLVLGLACCHPNPHHRPSMSIVMQVLTGEAAPPVVPKRRPAFLWPASHDGDSSTTGSQLNAAGDLEMRRRFEIVLQEAGDACDERNDENS